MVLNRRLALAAASCGLALAGCSASVPTPAPSSASPSAPGQLGSTWGDITLGTHVTRGATLTDTAVSDYVNDSGSVVVLEAVSPMAVSAGLTYLDTLVYLPVANLYHHLDGFPPASGTLATAPVAGTVVAPGDAFSLALGERVDGQGIVGLQDLVIDYRVDDRAYRTTLHYRSVLCPADMPGTGDSSQHVDGLPDVDVASPTHADGERLKAADRELLAATVADEQAGHRLPGGRLKP